MTPKIHGILMTRFYGVLNNLFKALSFGVLELNYETSLHLKFETSLFYTVCFDGAIESPFSSMLIPLLWLER